jgi:hypothetical protein
MEVRAPQSGTFKAGDKRTRLHRKCSTKTRNQGSQIVMSSMTMVDLLGRQEQHIGGEGEAGRDNVEVLLQVS